MQLLCKLEKSIFCLIQSLTMGCSAVCGNHMMATVPRWLCEWLRLHTCVLLHLPGWILSDGTFGCKAVCSYIYLLEQALLWISIHVCSQSSPTLCDPIDPRFLCPWDSPGRNTGVGCHGLLQGIFLTQGSNLCLLTSPALAGGFFTTTATWGTLEYKWLSLISLKKNLVWTIFFLLCYFYCLTHIFAT